MKRIHLLLVIFLTVGSTFSYAGSVNVPSVGSMPEDVCYSANDNDSSQLVVYVEGASLYTNDIADGSLLTIYAITGQRVGSYAVVDNYVDLGEALPKGIYIVRVNGKSAKITIR